MNRLLVHSIPAVFLLLMLGGCEDVTSQPWSTKSESIANGEAPINQCPPGGQATIVALADLLDTEVLELNAEHGEHFNVPLIAIIDEKTCIGCTLCIQACPVDAILGSAKHMHTVIIDECTGCELCLPPCPVDCIDMLPIAQNIDDWKWSRPGDLTELAHEG